MVGEARAELDIHTWNIQDIELITLAADNRPLGGDFKGGIWERKRRRQFCVVAGQVVLIVARQVVVSGGVAGQVVVDVLVVVTGQWSLRCCSGFGLHVGHNFRINLRSSSFQKLFAFSCESCPTS